MKEVRSECFLDSDPTPVRKAKIDAYFKPQPVKKELNPKKRKKLLEDEYETSGGILSENFKFCTYLNQILNCFVIVNCFRYLKDLWLIESHFERF